jgi:hypothetical protein
VTIFLSKLSDYLLSFLVLLLNSSLILLAPTPTNTSSNSEPAPERKLTPASPATALASKVLPVVQFQRIWNGRRQEKEGELQVINQSRPTKNQKQTKSSVDHECM